MRPRFVVGTVTGHRYMKGDVPPYGNTRQPPGLSAHVYDTLHAYHVVGTFRSETRAKGLQSGSIGHAGAIAAAQALADRLNADG